MIELRADHGPESTCFRYPLEQPHESHPKLSQIPGARQEFARQLLQASDLSQRLVPGSFCSDNVENCSPKLSRLSRGIRPSRPGRRAPTWQRSRCLGSRGTSFVEAVFVRFAPPALIATICGGRRRCGPGRHARPGLRGCHDVMVSVPGPTQRRGMARCTSSWAHAPPYTSRRWERSSSFMALPFLGPSFRVSCAGG